MSSRCLEHHKYDVHLSFYLVLDCAFQLNCEHWGLGCRGYVVSFFFIFNFVYYYSVFQKIGVFRPFIFNVIVDMFRFLSAILLFIFCFVCFIPLFPLSYFQLNIFNILIYLLCIIFLVAVLCVTKSICIF